MNRAVTSEKERERRGKAVLPLNFAGESRTLCVLMKESMPLFRGRHVKHTCILFSLMKTCDVGIQEKRGQGETGGINPAFNERGGELKLRLLHSK